MKTLLAIQCHKSAEHWVWHHWPYWKKSGLDILGITGSDGLVLWPEAIPWAIIGGEELQNRLDRNCNHRLIQCFKHCLTDPRFSDYTDFMLIEYDAVIIGTPEPYPGGFASVLTAYCPPEWKTKSTRCFGLPWWMDRETATKFVECGEKMLAAGENDNGSPDVYCGLILDRTGIKHHPVNTFHRNTLDMRVPRMLNECRDAIAKGAWMVHGFRDEQHLDYVLGRIAFSDVKNILGE